MKSYLSQRIPNRLEGHDYSSKDSYFITICVKDRTYLFWENGVGADIIRPSEKIALSEIGIVVDNAIINIPICYPEIEIGKYCIMPDHIHLLISVMSDQNEQINHYDNNGKTLHNGQNGRIISSRLKKSHYQKSESL
jgi:REP element-mobilizing transposase RayT